ncbi:MAG: ribose 5-phosphate isomerase B [Bacteroidia bacterium]|nr:ribose 5-phosphate isomerase B [Bacteroidia bacterium]MDW8236437.1 ribose 5-phosphate isomerase B [Bacteroidia bacterium]
MQVWIGADHAGFPLKKALIAWLQSLGHEVIDVGTFSEESTDYPIWVHRLVQQMERGGKGILICGSGNGVCITANRYPHIRAALAWNAEIARLARAHNDANILCLPGRFITPEEAMSAVDNFLHTAFEGGRHERRIAQINASSV